MTNPIISERNIKFNSIFRIIILIAVLLFISILLFSQMGISISSSITFAFFVLVFGFILKLKVTDEKSWMAENKNWPIVIDDVGIKKTTDIGEEKIDFSEINQIVFQSSPQYLGQPEAPRGLLTGNTRKFGVFKVLVDGKEFIIPPSISDQDKVIKTIISKCHLKKLPPTIFQGSYKWIRTENYTPSSFDLDINPGYFSWKDILILFILIGAGLALLIILISVYYPAHYSNILLKTNTTSVGSQLVSATSDQTSTSTDNQNKTAEWKMYVNNRIGFSLSLPSLVSIWDIENRTSQNSSEPPETGTSPLVVLDDGVSNYVVVRAKYKNVAHTQLSTLDEVDTTNTKQVNGFDYAWTIHVVPASSENDVLTQVRKIIADGFSVSGSTCGIKELNNNGGIISYEVTSQRKENEDWDPNCPLTETNFTVKYSSAYQKVVIWDFSHQDTQFGLGGTGAAATQKFDEQMQDSFSFYVYQG